MAEIPQGYGEELSPQQRRLLELMLNKKQEARRKAEQKAAAAGTIPRRSAEEPPLLSFAQQRLWFIQQFQPGNAAYNIPSGVRLRGPLDAGFFGQSLVETVRRHETMRTTYVLRGALPVQIISPEARAVMSRVDLSALPRTRVEPEAQRVVDGAARYPFEMARSSPWRALLLRLDAEEHVFLAVKHHILSDTWTTGVFFREMVGHYRALVDGVPARLPELKVQYADYALWQRRELGEGGLLETQLTYWTRKFEGAPPLLSLPLDRPRPPVPSFRGGRVIIVLPNQLTDRLKALSGRQEATLFMTLMTAYQSLLHRYTGEEDLLVGTPMANRDRVELENLIGLFVNTLVLRTNFSGRPTFRQLLDQVRRTTLEGLSHHDVPFERVVEELNLERDTSRNPLFQVLFAFQNVPIPALVAEGLTLERYEFQESTARLDLELDLQEMPYGFVGWLGYNSDLFEATTVQRMASSFRTLLDGIVEEPDRPVPALPLASAGERHQVLTAWNDTQAAYPRDVCLHQLFEAQAERTPDAVAVDDGSRRLSYGELEARANQLAHLLLSLGADALPVAVYLRRSVDCVAALLGILKAGGSYVPMDLASPVDRLEAILRSAGISRLVTESSLLASVAGLAPLLEQVVCLDEPEEGTALAGGETAPRLLTRSDITARPRHRPALSVDPGTLAYTIFTSGSTGTPKGVMVRHRPVANLIGWVNSTFGVTADDRLLCVASLSFDLSVYDVFGILAAGATIRLATGEEVRNPEALIRILEEEPITFWDSAPAALQQLVGFFPAEPLARSALRLVFLSGDWIPVALPEQVRAVFSRARMISLGGATEATVWSNVFPVREVPEWWVSIPYGRPIPNAQYYVLDAAFEPRSIGVEGDLFIGGECLASGYLASPALTALKYVPDPWSGASGGRLYRTGDRVRFWADANLEFLGRRDHQVKIRGYRIELGEIASILGQHPQLRDTVVLVREDVPGDRRLVAYVVGEGGETPPGHELRAYLQRKLPDYMVPAAFVILEALPVTANGKLDRQALPAPAGDRPELPSEFAEARTGTERQIGELWKKTLQIDQVGRDDNFFDLGGHSMLLTQIHQELQKELAPELTLVDMFTFTTIASLAAHLSRSGKSGSAVQASLEHAEARRSRVVSDTEVAIIGMALRYPQASTPEKFWDNLRNGRECIEFFSREEVLAAGVAPEVVDHPDYVRAEGTVADVELFDHEFFGYADPAEVELLDPQQRIFMECAWEAFERAGYDPRVCGGRTGIFGGVNISSYLFNALYDYDPVNVMSSFLTRIGLLVGNQNDYLCTRVAYHFDLKGPCLTVQTACSTATVATHLACQSLLRHECDLSLAGGVQIRVPQNMGYMYQEGGFPSPDGHCRSFDAKAKGNVHGNGAGVLVLKRLADAITDRDHIHAVIQGSAVTNDGSAKVGFTAPGVDGQARAVAEALGVSGVGPESIGYLEATGTGTELGDPIEIEALTRAFRLKTAKTGFCPIGSVKSNIGHTDAASGAAALIKTALALEHEEIPPSLHFEEPNPRIDFAASPFFVNAQLRPWPRQAEPRRAGVHTYAVGGTNTHIILAEAPEVGPSSPSRPWQLLLISARSSAALHRAAENLRAHLESEEEAALPDVAYTLQVGRRHFRHRRFALCRTGTEAVEVLREMPPARLRSSHVREEERRTSFLMPGTLPNTATAAGLYRAESAFREAVDRCAGLLEGEARQRLSAFFAGDSASEAPAHLEPLLTFTSEYALAQVWLEWGVAPAAVLGRGTGELTAACLTGALPLAGALALAAAWGRAQEPGVRLEVHLAASELEPYLDGGMAFETLLGEALCLVVGPEEAAEDLQDRLNDEGVDCFHLGPATFFSTAGELRSAWRGSLAKPAWGAGELPWLSSSTGTWVAGKETAGLWEQGLGGSALYDAFGELLKDDTRAFLEVGTGDLLSGALRRLAVGRPIFAALAAGGGLEDEDASATAQLLANLGRLWLAGVDVDWRGLARHEKRYRRPLPTYPFERIRIWAEPKSDRRQIFQAPPDLAAKDELDRWFYTPSWHRAPATSAAPPSADGAPWLVLTEPEGAAARLTERLRGAGHEVVTVSPGEAYARLGDGAYTVAPGDGESYRQLLAELHDAGHRPAVALHLWYLKGGEAAAPPWAGEAAEQGFWSLLHLARAFAEHGTEPLRLVAVTQGVEEVTGEEELLPARSPLAALVQTLSREMAWIAGRHVDVVVPAAETCAEARLLDELVREVARSEAEPRVAYRGRHRWVAGFERLQLDATPDAGLPARLRPEGVYVITGGTGRLALVAARFLARTARAKLVLVGESGLPAKEGWDTWLAKHREDDATSRKITRLRELEGLGAELLLVDADLTSTAALAAAVRRVRERFGTLDGVIHAAGEPSPEDARDIASIDADFFQYRLRERLLSVVTLAEVLRDEPPELHLLSATLGGVLGAALAAIDNAADAFLAAFARHAGQHDGASWTSVDWDLVDLGEAEGDPATSTAITAAEAEEVLGRVLGAAGELSQVTVSTVDLDARLEDARRTAAEPEEEAREIQPRPELETPYAAPQDGAEKEVAEIWTDVLGFERVGVQDNFFDLGGNSLMATQLVSRLRERFDIDLALRDFFEEATVARVAQSVELARWMSAPQAAEDGVEGEFGEI